MARWKTKPRIEFPAWVRVFDPAAWTEPGDDELPEWLRDHYQRGRWVIAKSRYYKANPDAGAQALEELMQRRYDRLSTPPDPAT